MTVEERCTRRCNNTVAGIICDPCYADTWADLCALDDLWDDVHAALGIASGSGDKVSGTVDIRPLGVNVTALSWITPARHDAEPGAGLYPDDQTGPLPLLDTLTAWCRAAADVTGHRGTFLGWTVDQLVAFLAYRFPIICEQTWSPDFAEEIRDQAAHGRGIVGDRPAPSGFRDGVRCPDCDTFTLYLRPASRFTECEERAGGCGRMWSPTEWNSHCKREADKVTDLGLAPVPKRLLDVDALARAARCVCGDPFADHRRPDGVPGLGKASFRCPAYRPAPPEEKTA